MVVKAAWPSEISPPARLSRRFERPSVTPELGGPATPYAPPGGPVEVLAVEWLLDAAERDSLLSFYRTTLKLTGWVDLTSWLPSTAGWYRFRRGPVDRPLRGARYWRVTAELERVA